MKDYQEHLAQKVTQIIERNKVEGDWNSCRDQIVRLLISETGKSFQNGIRWTQQNKRRGKKVPR